MSFHSNTIEENSRRDFIDLNGKRFRALSNSENGEVSGEVIFKYFQEGSTLWAHYQGGTILKGFLVGFVKNQQLEFSYQHVNEKSEILTGRCTTEVFIRKDGLYELNEKWQWTCKDHSVGESKLLEIRE